MATNPSRQTYTPGEDIPCKASTAVIGARFVSIGTNGTKPNPNVKPSVAGAKPFGVAAHDAPLNSYVSVRKGGVVQVLAGAALTAGDEVEANATGHAIVKNAGVAAGRVVYDAANGTLAEIDLY